jgi:phosphoglycerate dehydrogenase-like enzyme
LIPHDFSYHKYYPGQANLPYEATGDKLRDEIIARDPHLNVMLASSASETESMLYDAEGYIAYSVGRGTLERAPKLTWIQAGSAGIDHFFKTSGVTLSALHARGISLTKASGVTRFVIGEHVFAMLLALSRKIPTAVTQKKERVWRIYMGGELRGATLGIVGLGEIGNRVAELGKAFQMRVIGTKRNREGYAGVADAVFAPEEIYEVLRAADCLVLACSLNKETRQLINAQTLARMKPTAVIVNVARGEIIVEDDLVKALEEGVVAGAALDTFGVPGRDSLDELEALDRSSRLWQLPNVLITPNNAAATPKVYEYLADIIVENAARLRAGRPLRFEVKTEDWAVAAP